MMLPSDRVLVVAMSNHLIRERVVVSEIEAVRCLAWRYGLEAATLHAGAALELARTIIKGAA